MIIQVLTAAGQPEFEFYGRNASEVDKVVKQKYGCQSNGTLHNWRGLTPIESDAK